MWRRIALIALLAGGYAVAMYTSTGCGPYESSPSEPETLVRGRVLNAATNAPVASASVSIVQQNVRVVTTAGPDGAYRLAPLPGQNQIEVTAPGFQPFTATINVRVGTTTTFDVRLQPAS